MEVAPCPPWGSHHGPVTGGKATLRPRAGETEARGHGRAGAPVMGGFSRVTAEGHKGWVTPGWGARTGPQSAKVGGEWVNTGLGDEGRKEVHGTPKRHPGDPSPQRGHAEPTWGDSSRSWGVCGCSTPIPALPAPRPRCTRDPEPERMEGTGELGGAGECQIRGAELGVWGWAGQMCPAVTQGRHGQGGHRPVGAGGAHSGGAGFWGADGGVVFLGERCGSTG